MRHRRDSLPLGSDAVDAIIAHLDAVRADVTTWEPVARATAYDQARGR